MFRTHDLLCSKIIHAAEIKSLQIEILRMQKELQQLQQWKCDVIKTIHRKKQHALKTRAKSSVAVQTECTDCVVTLQEYSDDFEYV